MVVISCIPLLAFRLTNAKLTEVGAAKLVQALEKCPMIERVE